ncbi:universal stress protein [Segetibacter koreensis]|uniref:universal stress protein n=1 Tax=Segetibacter koreensis TaxID=398037 RepID=UPI000368BC1B|nr:universal stress protein [Segetibacter koreensis]
MPTIIVCTNFSKTSRNALTYACSLINSKKNKEAFDILLLHIFTIPPNYSGDGIALVTINNSLIYVEEDLHEELEWVHEEYPTINVIGKVTTGRLLEGLEEEIQEMNASLVIIGAGGHYGDLWSWDNSILTALRDLSVPILTIPPNVTFSPLQNIAFACNLKSVSRYTPFNALKKIIQFTEAKLHVVYVAGDEVKKDPAEAQNELFVHEKLDELSPVYHTLYESEVVGAIGRFVENEHIQLLLVIPRKHGIWDSLFHKSYTKELSRLNRLPIMALH